MLALLIAKRVLAQKVLCRRICFAGLFSFPVVFMAAAANGSTAEFLIKTAASRVHASDVTRTRRARALFTGLTNAPASKCRSLHVSCSIPPAFVSFAQPCHAGGRPCHTANLPSRHRIDGRGKLSGCFVPLEIPARTTMFHQGRRLQISLKRSVCCNSGGSHDVPFSGKRVTTRSAGSGKLSRKGDRDEKDEGLPCLASMAKTVVQLTVPTPEDMEDLGRVLSVNSTRGDVVFLGGDLGAGKTCFARGFVRARAENDKMRVTSPTYLLANVYPVPPLDDDDMGECLGTEGEGGGGIEGSDEEDASTLFTAIHHMDLYRLSGTNPDEFDPLDLPFALESCICLIEWPERLGAKWEERMLLTNNCLYVNLWISEEDSDREGIHSGDDDSIPRLVELIACGTEWKTRLDVFNQPGHWLSQHLTEGIS